MSIITEQQINLARVKEGGSATLYGTNPPTADIGNNGDTYITTTTANTSIKEDNEWKTIQDVATIAQTLGGNRVVYSDSVPVGDFKDNDVWFDSSNGYRMSKYNETDGQWQETLFNTESLAAGCVTARTIATGEVWTADITAQNLTLTSPNSQKMVHVTDAGIILTDISSDAEATLTPIGLTSKRVNTTKRVAWIDEEEGSTKFSLTLDAFGNLLLKG